MEGDTRRQPHSGSQDVSRERDTRNDHGRKHPTACGHRTLDKLKSERVLAAAFGAPLATSSAFAMSPTFAVAG